MQAVEMEKAMDEQKRKDNRAPKSVEQKKKISEAVRVKWAVHHRILKRQVHLSPF